MVTPPLHVLLVNISIFSSGQYVYVLVGVSKLNMESLKEKKTKPFTDEMVQILINDGFG